SVETSEQRVRDTNKKDNTHANLVGYACNRIHQYAARHSHTNQPYKPIEDADQKEQDPCRLSIPQPDEVATCITHGHQCTNSFGKWREKQQAQCSSRVSDHSPDAEFEGKLRRKHGGIGSNPGSHYCCRSQGKTYPSPGKHVAVHRLCATTPVVSEAYP